VSDLFIEINEIAIAVNDLDRATERYGALLQAPVESETRHDEEGIGIRQRGLWVGDTHLTFVTDLTGDGPVARFLTTRGEGLYELCLKVSDLEAAIEHMKSQGVRFASETPAILRNYKYRDKFYSEVHVVFLHPKTTHGVLIEMQQWFD
jgi:methylmalonyl-CoA epimerase